MAHDHKMNPVGEPYLNKKSGPRYYRPDGSSRPKPSAHSRPEDWADYHDAADHFLKNKATKQQPFDPYLNTWA
jgi:hypothetical protein